MGTSMLRMTSLVVYTRDVCECIIVVSCSRLNYDSVLIDFLDMDSDDIEMSSTIAVDLDDVLGQTNQAVANCMRSFSSEFCEIHIMFRAQQTIWDQHDTRRLPL